MNRYIYHYCAKIPIGHIDGVAYLTNRISGMDSYMELKPLISKEHHDKLTILSLSFLGMEKEAADKAAS